MSGEIISNLPSQRYKKSASIVIVSNASEFQNIDSSRMYTFDGVIDMGSNSIDIPSTEATIYLAYYRLEGLCL